MPSPTKHQLGLRHYSTLCPRKFNDCPSFTTAYGMYVIQIFEDGNIMSHRTIFDPWGPREQRDGGLLGDLIPDQTRLKSKSIGN
jgi:hypothetical protein